MVEYLSRVVPAATTRGLKLDTIFHSLSDPTRRDILRRVARAKEALSVGEIAKSYKLTFAAISKHLKILEKAKLIRKHKHGREHMIQLSPAALKDAEEYLQRYAKMWEDRLDRLDELLKKEKYKK